MESHSLLVTAFYVFLFLDLNMVSIGLLCMLCWPVRWYIWGVLLKGAGTRGVSLKQGGLRSDAEYRSHICALQTGVVGTASWQQ